MALHELPLDASVLHGHFSRELEPVLTVDPGDSVRFSMPNAGWDVGRDETFESRNPELDTGHALAGPIEVRGARAGQVLAVRIDEVAPGLRGASRSGGQGASGRLGARRRHRPSRADRSVRLAPFLGVLGMPPAEPGAHSTIPPRPLRRQHRLQGARRRDDAVSADPRRRRALLRRRRPRRPGRRRGLGDGDREPRSRRRLTLDVRDDLSLEWPLARIDGAWLTFGFDEHLGKAAKIAVDGMLDLMVREHGLDRSDALAFASVVVDLRVTQVVNQVLGVHAVLRDDAFM